VKIEWTSQYLGKGVLQKKATISAGGHYTTAGSFLETSLDAVDIGIVRSVRGLVSIHRTHTAGRYHEEQTKDNDADRLHGTTYLLSPPIIHHQPLVGDKSLLHSNPLNQRKA
jgi:hypothetical protein